MKVLMLALVMLTGVSAFAEVNILDAGPCIQVAERKVLKLYNNPDTVHETTIDNVQGDVEKSGTVTYTISTGNSEDGYYPYTVVIQQTLSEDGSANCKIVSAK